MLQPHQLRPPHAPFYTCQHSLVEGLSQNAGVNEPCHPRTPPPPRAASPSIHAKCTAMGRPLHQIGLAPDDCNTQHTHTCGYQHMSMCSRSSRLDSMGRHPGGVTQPLGGEIQPHARGDEHILIHLHMKGTPAMGTEAPIPVHLSRWTRHRPAPSTAGGVRPAWSVSCSAARRVQCRAARGRVRRARPSLSRRSVSDVLHTCVRLRCVVPVELEFHAHEATPPGSATSASSGYRMAQQPSRFGNTAPTAPLFNRFTPIYP